jgi:stage II sporulation protein M
MQMIKRFYSKEWSRFRKKFFKIFVFVLIIFVLLVFFSHVFLVKNPDQVQKIITELQKKLLERIPLHTTGIRLFLAIFLNNLRISFFSILFGLIPFLFLPILGIFRNAIFMGAVTAVSHLKGMKVYEVLLLYIMPHGIFELPAIIYSVSLGIFLSFHISKRILLGHSRIQSLDARDKNDEESMFALLKRAFMTWIGVIVPLLFLGAIVEAFIIISWASVSQ